MSRGDLISEAHAAGFTFHHAGGDRCMLSLWLREGVPSTVPPYATHQVGVAGVVMDEDTRLLLVKEAAGPAHVGWKFPGGLADLGEEISDTAVREVFEETGIQAEFHSLLAFRHQHGMAFGRSDLYYLCRLRPLSHDIRLDPAEIAEACWMPAHQFIATCTHPISRLGAQLALDSWGVEHAAKALTPVAAAARKAATSQAGASTGGVSSAASGAAAQAPLSASSHGMSAAPGVPVAQELFESAVYVAATRKHVRLYHPAGPHTLASMQAAVDSADAGATEGESEAQRQRAARIAAAVVAGSAPPSHII